MFDQFKHFVQDGERYIVVESGEPRFVVMSFRDYRDLTARYHRPAATAKVASNPVSEWEGASAEFVVEPPRADAIDPSTVRLEDLPL